MEELNKRDGENRSEEVSLGKDTPTEAVQPTEGEAVLNVSEVENAPEQSVAEAASTSGTEVQAEPAPLEHEVAQEDDEEAMAEGESDEGAEEAEETISDFSLEELCERMAEVVAEGYSADARLQAESLRGVYYRKLEQWRREQQELARAGVEGEGEEQQWTHETEERMRTLVAEYKQARREALARLEAEREANLKAKQAIIEKIKELVSRQEVLGETYQAFNALREEWSKIGSVPSAHVKELYEAYHYQVQVFYDYVKINRELRDLDYRKNLEAKTGLCEYAEELIAEPDVRKAFKLLQDLHERWKEIGPVVREKKEELWERFSRASREINTRHREYYAERQRVYEANYELKEALVAKVETIVAGERDSMKAWMRDSAQMIECQKEWKAIGPVPRKKSNAQWERFREVCDNFFNARREYEKVYREEGQANLQKRLDLCIQAEALKDSEDWSNTSREMIALQRQWKTIGFVPRRKGQELWERFQGATNYFFEHRNAVRDARKREEAENLRLKRAIVEELRTYESTDMQETITWLKDIQARWNAIGFVPYKAKDALHTSYREALDARYTQLRGERRGESVQAFKERVSDLAEGVPVNRVVKSERKVLQQRVKSLEEEKLQMETNLSFFTSDDDENPILLDFRGRLAKLDAEIAGLQEKLKHVRRLERDAAAEQKETKNAPKEGEGNQDASASDAE